MTEPQPETRSNQAEHSEWESRLGRIALAVDGWRERTRNPTPVDPGSSLAADSMEGLSVDNPIWYSMCISYEHLDFALETMRETNTMYPTAYMTVARTAFIAAVNAVWMLAPSGRQERRLRALRIRADDIRVQVTAMDDLRLQDDTSAKAHDSQVSLLRDRQRSLQLVADALGTKEDVSRMKFNQTEAIAWVARHMHGVDDNLLVGATMAVWRAGSAAAHAQYHFGARRADRPGVPHQRQDSSLVRLRGDLTKDVGPALAAAAMTLSEAFRLYDLRGVSHDRI